MAKHVEFRPPESVKGFLVSDKFANFIVGPIGSTKTSAAIMKIAYEAKRVAPTFDGIRKSKVVWVRNTSAMLKDSSIPDFLKWFPEGEAGTFARTDLKFTLVFDDVECQILFRGLDDSADVRRLLSLNLSFAVIDEFREINPDVYRALVGRLGRYPDKSMNGVGCCDDSGKLIKKVWGATNPPDMGSHWEDVLSNPPSNTAVFFQPSGVSPEADWLQYLDPDYYTNLIEGNKQEWVDVYIHAKFGKSLAGQPVFKAFDADTHVANDELRPSPVNGTLWVGIDNGLSPAAVLGQVDFSGRVLVYDAIYAEGLGALRFCRERLKPLLARKYPGFKVQLIADPACMQRSQADEKTIVDIYRAEGLSIVTAKTNVLTARIASVDYYLTRTVEGKSSILLCPVGCKPLIQSMRGKYRYKTNTKGETDTTPEKSHPFSDLADALQYLCLHANGGAVYGAPVSSVQRRDVKQVKYAW